MSWVGWLENHLLPCSYKQFLGVCCPLCGTQRALIALLKGNFMMAVKIFPPVVLWGATALVLLFGFPFLQKRHYKIIIAINLLALFFNAIYQNIV